MAGVDIDKYAGAFARIDTPFCEIEENLLNLISV